MSTDPDTMREAAESEVRMESDGFGEIGVPVSKLWGAQTERARKHFPVGGERFRWSRAAVRALGLVKLCAAEVNRELGVFERAGGGVGPGEVAAIVEASREVMEGRWDEEFPLGIFQSGSGTQTHMNANEVIARRANQLLEAKGGGSVRGVHPNDDVNKGQSSNDVMPTVMHVATVMEMERLLIPAVVALSDTWAGKAREYAEVIMLGRTHLQDATPIALGQVISGWAAQLEEARRGIESALHTLHPLAIGGTAVGTGLNAHPRFGELVAARLAVATGQPFVSAENKFAALSGQEGMVAVSAALRTLAGALLKMANDVRWYSSGPRAGLGELRIPPNEPGSSIMPGKVNPTQCEALAMIAVQVFGNDQAVAIAGSQGNFQLNVYKPIILHNVLESVELLAEGCDAFRLYCATGLRPNVQRITEHLNDSLMWVTALTGEIGYDRAAAIAKLAHQEGLRLRDAAIRSGVDGEVYDRCVGEALRQTTEASRRQLRRG